MEIALTQINVYIDTVEAGIEFTSRLSELESGAWADAENVVNFLRSVPAEAMAKKRELGKFFETESGGRYSREERKAFYDALLGGHRNSELRG